MAVNGEPGMTDREAALIAERDALVAALRRYAIHTVECAELALFPVAIAKRHHHRRCSCKLDDALRPYPEEE